MQSTDTDQTPVLHEDHAIMADGYQLPVRTFEAAKDQAQAVVLAIHGLNDYSNAFQSTGTYLAQNNISLIAYDQRGFGRSADHGYWHGTETLAHDLQTMIGLIHTLHPDLPLYVLGESMGGAVALAALNSGQNHPEVEGIILSAPAVWARSTMPLYQRIVLAIMAHTFPSMQFTGKGLKITPSDNIDMLRALSRDPLVIKKTRVDVLYGLSELMDKALSAAPEMQDDMLILYGKKDEIIPRKPLCRLMELLPPEEPPQIGLILYSNGYHMLTRDLQAGVVLEDMRNWIVSRQGTRETIPGETDEKLVKDFCSD